MSSPRKLTRPNHMTPVERDECICLYMAGATLDSLQDRYDRERSTISRLIRRRKAKRGSAKLLTINKNVVS
jgi:hypothetical protein